MQNTMRLSKNYAGETNFGNSYRNARSHSKTGTSPIYQNTMYGSVNNSMQYMFKERGGKLRWKEVINLDLESMIRNNDLTPLENYLENLIFSSIEENDIQIVPEASLVKLVKIYQHILEYLLYSQQKLESENRTLESNYNQLVNDSMSKETVLKENKSLIHTLKKDKREKEMVLNTYKVLIDEYKTNNKGGVNMSKAYYYCDICEGKKFSTEENLENHMARRHNNNNLYSRTLRPQVQTPISYQQDPVLNDKLDLIKSHFDTFIKNNQNESYLKLFDNQKNLENKINELKHEQNVDIKNDISSLEKTFKNTLLEMKELYLSNSMNPGAAYMNTPQPNTINNNEETASILKSQAKQMNEIITEMSKIQNERIQVVTEQLQNFKQSISNEFRELRSTSEAKKEAPAKPVFTTVARNVSLELVAPKKINNLLRESHSRRSINKTKHIFNSGPLESDNSDFNEDENVQKTSMKPKQKEKSVEKNMNNFVPIQASVFQIDKIEKVEKVEEPKALDKSQDYFRQSRSEDTQEVQKPISPKFTLRNSRDSFGNGSKNLIANISQDMVNLKETESAVMPSSKIPEHNTKEEVQNDNVEELPDANKPPVKPKPEETKVAKEAVVPEVVKQQQDKASRQMLSDLFDSFVDREYDFIETHESKEYKSIM